MVEEIKKVLSCSDEEAEFVQNIYLQAKKLDKDLNLEVGKDLVGVRKAGEYLRFYFSNKNGEIMVKFKHRPRAVKLASLPPEKLYGEIKDVTALFKTGNFKLSDGTSRAIFKVEQSRYDFINAIAEGIDPFSGKKLVNFPQNVKQTLKNIGLFILRYEKLGSTSFKAMSSDQAISKKAETILSQKREKQVVVGRVGSLWTQEEDERLREEYMKSVPISDIAALHGRTITAVQRRILSIIPISEIRK